MTGLRRGKSGTAQASGLCTLQVVYNSREFEVRQYVRHFPRCRGNILNKTSLRKEEDRMRAPWVKYLPCKHEDLHFRSPIEWTQ